MAEGVSRRTCFGNPWSPDEISTLRVLKPKLSTEEIAKLLDRSPQAVRIKISRLKIGRKYRCPAFEMRRGKNVAAS